VLLAWWALHDFVLYIAGEVVEKKNPVDEVDLLMQIAESLPGVSTRFGSSTVILSLIFDFFSSTPLFYYSIFMPTFSHAVKLQGALASQFS